MAMTVADLIATLEGMDPDAEVKLAMQPSYPMEYTISDVTEAEGGTVYLAEGTQNYMGSVARESLGW